MTEPPTHRQADGVLGRPDVGARLAEGPFQQLERGRWAVPAVAYMSLQLMADFVLRRREDGRWEVDRKPGGRPPENPDLALFGQRGLFGRGDGG